MGQQIGYRRVSTLAQTTVRQLVDVELDRVFEDRLSGGTRERPELEAMLRHVRAGDTIHVHSIDRLARNLADLQVLVQTITDEGVSVHFHKEGLTFAGDGSSLERLQLQLMGAFAEFERALITERASEGRALAVERGVRFGPARGLSSAKQRAIVKQYQDGAPVARLALDNDVSRRTIHRTIERAGVQRPLAKAAGDAASEPQRRQGNDR